MGLIFSLKNKKGQAALTDSLYFLLIVTLLCVLLFYFSSKYGHSVASSITSKYNSDFSSDVLRTILYSSIYRDNYSSMSGGGMRYADYLMVYLKENYYKKNSLNDCNKIIKDTINSIMKPYSSSFDYIFIISSIGTNNVINFDLVVLHLNCYYDANCTEKHFLCNPQGWDRLDNFFARANVLYGSSASIYLVGSSSGSDVKNAKIHFFLWTTTRVDPSELDLSCQEIS